MSSVYEQRKSEYLGLVVPYLDRNFSLSLSLGDRRIGRESELILGYELLRNGYALQKRQGEEGPDFLVMYEGKKVWIEIITPIEGSYPRFKNSEPIRNGVFAEVNIDNCKLKIASGIKDKKDRFLEYIQSGVVAQDDIKIICVNVYNLDAGPKSCPHCASVLYGIEETWFIDTKTYEQGRRFLNQSPVVKPSGNSVRLGFFNDQDYKNIDAVLWFDYGLGTIVPDKCDIQLLANNKSEEKIGKLFVQWERVFYEDGRLFQSL